MTGASAPNREALCCAARESARLADLPERQRRRTAVVGRLFLAGFAIAMAVVVARVAQLQLAPPPALRAQMGDRASTRIEPATRGDLLDRRGRVIASGLLGWRLFVDPAMFPEPYDTSIQRLARALGMDVSRVGTRIMERIARNERRADRGRSLIRYVSIAGPLEDWRVEAIRALDMPGVHLETMGERDQTAPRLAGALAGFVGVDQVGLLGAERLFNQALQPRWGRLSYLRDARGAPLWVEAGGYDPAEPGMDVRLSVDLSLQAIALEELRRGVEDVDAAAGRLVMIDPLTGEILAMADVIRRLDDAVPFDPSLVGRDGARQRFLTVRPDPQRRIGPQFARNRCVEDAYEPGSTFKPFMWAAALEQGVVEPDETIDTAKGRWRTDYGRVLEDVAPREEQTWKEVLVNSSNIGMAKGTRRLSHGQMREAVLRFGFGSPTGLGLPGEAAGLVTSARDWSKYTQTSVAMGYEVAVTPVQMARAFGAFARTGRLAGTLPNLRLRSAHFVEPQDELIYRVLPPGIASLARRVMRSVPEKMDDRLQRAGVLAKPPRYSMFGKSGTAKIARPDGRGYLERQYVSSFIAGAPVETPRIVALVVIDDPGLEAVRTGRYYGSWVAGPIVRRVVDRALTYLGEPPDLPARGR